MVRQEIVRPPYVARSSATVAFRCFQPIALLQTCLQIPKLMYPSAPCGISADEKTMQHLINRPTFEAGLPVIRHGQHPACVLELSLMITRPEGLRLAK
jgi:hypothetical protein